MFGLRIPVSRRNRDDGEKPFWISFSDLMSALMVLFLVAMSVALLAVTTKINIEDTEEKERAQDISNLLNEVKRVADQFDGVKVLDKTIDFGPKAIFELEGQNTLSEEQRLLLRDFTPKLLEKLSATEEGKKWFKRAVVEGYASRTGTYLFNLNLSLERSQRVLCELLSNPADSVPLGIEDRRLIAQRFFVGGASFNSLRQGTESKRIEFKLEFKTREELKTESLNAPASFDLIALDKALDPKEPCQIRNR